MGSLLQDLQYSIRILRKSPVFSLISVLALAIVIGANSAIFSMVNAVLLRQLPFENPDQLIWIWLSATDREKGLFSVPDFEDFKDQNRTLEEMAAFANVGVNLTDRGDPERLQGIRMSANAFQMLGVDASAGRTLQPDDDKPGSQRVVVLSHGLWVRRFGGDRGLIGQTLTLNGDAYTVVGVLPPHFLFPLREAELAFPLSPDTDPRRKDRNDHFLRVVARLKPGNTKPQAQADLDAITRRLQEQYPQTNAKIARVKLVALHDEIVGDLRLALLMLMGAVGLVLLIACSNLANLLLARASTRHKEIAIRMSLGVTRMRLVRQLLTESTALALMGGALGLILTWWGVRLLLTLSPADLPRAGEVGIDERVLGFTLGISLLAGVIFGLTSALQTTKINLGEELKAGGRGGSDGARYKSTRSLLVVLEVALSLLLLISTGLFVKSFLRLQQVNPGFDARDVLVMRLSLPRGKYSEPHHVATFYEQLRPRIERLPEVQSVGTVSILPLSGLTPTVEFTSVEHPPASPTEIPAAQYRIISADYFHTMKIPVLKGREFTEWDRASTPGVAVVSEALARRFWPNEDALGAHLKVDEGEREPRQVEIVGIVGSVKHIGLDDEPTSDIYVPYYQIPKARMNWATNNMYWVARTASDPLTLATAVRREAQAIDKDVPASGTRTMEQFLSASVAPRRFNLLLLAIFAGAALLLAATGIYAVISYSISQRTQEIGVRMALGARPRDVLRLVVGQGLRPVLIGVVVGLTGAFASTRVVSSLLFGVSSVDPITFAAMPLLLIGMAALACYIPARKATKIDPVIALRAE